MKKHFIIIFLIALTFNLIAQDSLKHEIKHFTGSDGKLYWNEKLPFYISISSSPDEKPILLKSETTPKFVNPSFWDGNGTHHLKHDIGDNQNAKISVPGGAVIWEVYSDGINPVTTSEFLKAEKSIQNNITYYGPNLEVPIKATDNLSGVEKTYYSINKEKWIENQTAIKFQTEGSNILKYYSVDNVGNAENYNVEEFVVDLTSPATYYTIVGIALENNIISTTTLITLASEDKYSGVAKIYYKIDNNAEVLYKGGNIPISLLDNGNHKLTFYAIDNVKNKETEQVFDFYLDRIAPILTSDVLGDRYIVDGQVYFSGRTKMKLTAVDNKSGIKQVLFSIDGEDFVSYNDPFYLPSVQGTHVVRYFAIDKVENNTNTNNSVNYQLDNYKYNVNKIYVDLIGPTLSFNYIGDYFKARDTVFINSKTKIKMNATDAESGLQYISYSLNNVLEETKYSEAFTIDKQGFNQIEYFGYDNVNNRNKADFTFIVDNEGPELKYNFSIESIGSKNGLDMYPNYVMLYLAATDEKVGTKEIYYSLNGSPEKLFSKYIESFASKTENNLKIRILDKLNNEKQFEIKFYTE